MTELILILLFILILIPISDKKTLILFLLIILLFVIICNGYLNINNITEQFTGIKNKLTPVQSTSISTPVQSTLEPPLALPAQSTLITIPDDIQIPDEINIPEMTDEINIESGKLSEEKKYNDILNSIDMDIDMDIDPEEQLFNMGVRRDYNNYDNQLLITKNHGIGLRGALNMP
jgi:hypothetical protein